MKEEEKPRVAARLYEAWQSMLPDSRLTRPRRTMRGPLGSMEECFCVNCGRSGGWVTEAYIDHILYLCDDCAVNHGRLPLVEVPEELVKGSPEEEAREAGGNIIMPGDAG